MSKNVAIFLAPGFEELEAIAPADILTRAGLDVHFVAVSDQHLVASTHGVEIKCTRLVSEVSGSEYDLLVLPGGMPGTTNLGDSEKIAQLVREFVAEDKPVSAICAAPSVLAQMGVLDGKEATCYPGFESVVQEGGAKFSEEAVVVAGKVITSRGPATAAQFGLELAKVMCGEETAAQVAAGMLF